MATPFKKRVGSIRELSESEFEVVMDALEGVVPLDEYFGDAQDSDCPAWLTAWLEELSQETLYNTTSGDAAGVCCFGLVWDKGTNECWTYGGTAEPSFRIAEVEGGRSSLTPESIWSLVREDLIDLASPVVWFTAWLNPNLVERELVEPFLREVLSDFGLIRMEGGQGESLEDWLNLMYNDGQR